MRCLVLSQAAGQRMRMRVADVIEGDDVDAVHQLPGRGALGFDQRSI